jgi:hypothetical protein
MDRVSYSTIILPVVLLSAPMEQAAAATSGEVRTFIAPAVNGVRLDWCKHFGRDCGQPAADLYCQQQGFDKATQFAIEPNIGTRGIATIVFGDGRQCQGPVCNGFRSITCMKNKLAEQQPAPPPRQTPDRPQPNPIQPARPPVPSLQLAQGATLYRCSGVGCDAKLSSDLELAVGGKNQVTPFGFVIPIDAMPQAGAVLWQVADRPFPAFGSGSPLDFAPPGLLDSGRLAIDKIAAQSGKKEGGFSVNFAPLAFKLGVGEIAKTGKASGKYNFHVRVLPLRAVNGDELAGQPTNVIRALYGNRLPSSPPFKFYAPVPYYDISIESFMPAEFADPNRWGCVILVNQEERCPEPYRGKSYQISSLSGFMDMLGGAWDWIADKYDKLKQIAVDVVMNYSVFGLQCQFATDLLKKTTGVEGQGACRATAELAVNAGMAAVGMPPSLPNYHELVDQGVDYGVELAALKIKETTGIPCEGPCRDALRAGLKETAAQLKIAAGQQACVGDEEAHRHGREQLCLPAEVVLKPAPGAAYRPPTMTIKVTRRPGAPEPERPCNLIASMVIKNRFPGGLVLGPGTASKTVPAQNVEGKLYLDVNVTIPNVKPDAPFVATVSFDHAEKFAFTWTRELWLRSQTPPDNFIANDWMKLYSGGTANLVAQSKCATRDATRTEKLQTIR